MSARASADVEVGLPLRSVELGAGVVEQLARGDHALYLAGALVDVGDPHVAEPLLEQVLARHAHRAEQLDAALRYQTHHGAGLRLAHRRLEVVGLALARQPRRAQNRELGRLDQRLELEELRDHRRLAVYAAAA